MKRRILSIAICLSMIMTVTNTNVFATEIEPNNGELIVSEEDTSDVISEEISISNSGEEITLDEEVDEINSAEETASESDDTITEEKSEDDGVVSENKIEESEEELLSVSENQLVSSGKFDDNITYSIYDTNGDGKGNYLEINGSGDMPQNEESYPFTSEMKENITEVVMSDDITSLMDGLFFEFTNLSDVSLPKSIKSISDGAFSKCTSLEKIDIPSGVTSIGMTAFPGCSSLSSITFPEGLTSIGIAAFAECSNLSTVTLPEGITFLGEAAFARCTKLSKVTLPKKLTSFGNSAFSGCNNLSTVIIPEGLTIIGQAAFSSCTNIVNISLPTSIQSIGAGAFSGCTNLSDISLPTSIQSIGSGAFSNCINLTSIEFPDNVTAIGSGAIAGCTNITTVTIPRSVTSIDSNFLNDLSGLKKVINKSNVDLTLPTTTEEKKWYFEDNIEMTSIASAKRTVIRADYYDSKVISEGGKIGENVYYVRYCDYETESGTGLVEIRGSGKMYDSYAPYSPLYYNQYAELVIFDGVTSIGDGISPFNYSLKKVTLPDSITSIGVSAFFNCSSLESINLSNSTTTIGDYAFYGCHLKEVTIPKGVTSIGDCAFSGCDFNNITIPNNVTNIGEGVIRNCNSLNRVENNSSTPIDLPTDSYMSYGKEFEHIWYNSQGEQITSIANGVATTKYECPVLCKLTDTSLLLTGDIGLNFYVELENEIVNEPTAYVMLNNTKYDISKAKTKSSNSKEYCFTYYLNAKEMNDSIKFELISNGSAVQLHNSMGDYKGTSFEYSVKQYKNDVDELEGYTNLKTLMSKLIRYGELAQLYFNYNTDGIEENSGNENLDAATYSKYRMETKGDLPKGINYYGSSLLLQSGTLIRHYFTLNKGYSIDDYSYTINGNDYDSSNIGKKGLYYYIEMEEAPGQGLNYAQVLTINDFELSYSPLSYVYAALNRNPQNESARLVAAMYNYHLAAIDYFGEWMGLDENELGIE